MLDALVVFGCRVIDGGPSTALRRRLRRAAELAALHPAAALIVSGGDAHGAVEAEVMRDWLVEHGVDPLRLRCELRARSTLENAVFVVPLIAALGARRLGLVTDAYHMRRAARLLCRALRQAGLGEVTVEALPAAQTKRWPARVGSWLTETIKLALDLGRRVDAGRPTD